MGAGKSRMNSAQCSKADFKNEGTLNTIASTHNTGKGNSRDHHRQQKGGCSKNNNNGFTSVVALAGCPQPQMENNSVWVCNNAMENYGTNTSNNRNYTVDVLQPVQQETARARAGGTSENYRKSNGNGKSRTTCCNCNCSCSRLKKMDYQTERRNGLQSISTLIEECRCRACNNGRMAQLSEAEAIAGAITEYCCRARKKAEREQARNKHKCCTCNAELKNNWRQQSIKTEDDGDEDAGTEPDVEIEVGNCCCSAQQSRVDGRRENYCKCSADMKRRMEDELEEEYAEEKAAVEEEHTLQEEGIIDGEVVEEKAAEELGVLTAAQRKRQHDEEEEQYSQSRHAQPHVKRRRCRDFKKQQSTKDQSIEDENKRRCCTYNAEFKNNWQQQSMETKDDDDEDADTEPDIETEVGNYCCSAQQSRVHGRRGKGSKCSADMKRRRRNPMEDEPDEEYEEEKAAVGEEHMLQEEGLMDGEVVEEKATEDISVLTAARRKRQHDEEEEQYSQIRQAQPHVKRRRCRDFKKQHSTKDQSDEGENELDISVEDIELERQEERNEKVDKRSALAPQSRRQPQKSDGQEQKPGPGRRTQEGSQYPRESSRTKGSEQNAFKQEKEVMLKKTNLSARTQQIDKDVCEVREKSSAKEVQTRQKPKQNAQQESETKAQRSRSEEMKGLRDKSQDYKKDKAETENQRKKETPRRYLNIEIVYKNQKGRRRRLEDATQSTRNSSRSREERAIADEPQSRRNISGRGEESTKSDKTQSGRHISRSRGEKTTAEDQHGRRNINHGRQKRQTTADIEEDDRVPSRERKPQEAAENDVQDSRSYERIPNQRNARTQATKLYQESIEDDKPIEEAAKQRRREPQNEPTQLRGCNCSDSPRTIAHQKPASEAELDAEVDMEAERQQYFCCFSRKRSQRKSGAGRSSSCCKSKKDRSAEKSKPKIEEKKSETLEKVEKPAKAKEQSEKECQTEYRSKKKKGESLTKCCKFHEDEYETACARDSKPRYREEDRRRSMLAEELADRLQKREQQQISLQKRMQEQMRAKPRQRWSCDQPPCCFPQFPSCSEQPMGDDDPEERPPLACCFPPPTPRQRWSCDQPQCCFPQFPCCSEQPMGGYDPEERPPLACCLPPPTTQMVAGCCPPPMSPPPYCLPTTPPCCYESLPSFGQECPCCCQPMPFCYAASCSYTKPGSSP